MNTRALILSELLTGSKVRLGLSLVVLGLVAALLLLAWCVKLSRDPRNLPLILFTGVIPLFLLALGWPLVRLPLFTSLVALLLLSCFSERGRRALHLLLMLFTGLIPLFLLIAVDDVSWSAGFLLVYLGITSFEATTADVDHLDGEDEMWTNPNAGTWNFIYCVALGFFWIITLAALLWYVPEPVPRA